MLKIRFYLSRLLRRENALAALSASAQDLHDELAGKSVALIGNARALSQQAYGRQIDSHDIVIRINRAPMLEAQTHGTRTDWLALATRLPQQDAARLAPQRFLWMSHKRKRLSYRIAHSAGFFLFPLARFEALKQRIGVQPTTGAMMIDFLQNTPAKSIDLYGFDFFSSLSLSGRRTADQVPHDFDAERNFVRALTEKDPRITLHPLK